MMITFVQVVAIGISLLLLLIFALMAMYRYFSEVQEEMEEVWIYRNGEYVKTKAPMATVSYTRVPYTRVNDVEGDGYESFPNPSF